jgi:type I restriction enzyme S subunit
MEVKVGYKQTEAGVIPNDWEVRRLKELFTIKSGEAFSSAHFSDHGPILLTPGNFNLDGGLYFNERNTKRYAGSYAPKMLFDYGDLLIVMTDLTPECNLLGKPAFVRIHEQILHNQRIGKIVPTSSRVALGFLYWYFLSDAHARRMKETATGSTVRHTSNGSIYASAIALPPTKAEQEAIAEALSDADALIESLERLVAKKRSLKQGVMQELLTAKERLPGFTGEWEVKRFGDVIRDIGDGATPSTANPRNFGGPINWVVIEDIRDEIVSTRSTLTERGLRSCAATLWPAGTLILSTGATIGEVGIAQVPVATKQGICGIVPYASISDAHFLKFWFLLNRPLLLSKAQGSTIKEIRVPTLVQFEIFLPPLAEQAAITTVLSDMDAEIAALEAKLVKARRLKLGMMQELLTGRIRLV